jgi:Bacterial Ig-like domain
VTFPASATYTITATARDAAGNVSSVSQAATVIVNQTELLAPTLFVNSSCASSCLTNANLVPIGGVTSPGATVTVYQETQPETIQLTQATADAKGNWSATLALADGRYVIEANATNGVTTSPFSPSVTLVVDREPPAIVSQIPVPGASDVWWLDPITVTFNKPMNTASVVSNVRLSGRGANEGSIPIQVSFDPSGTILTAFLSSPVEVPDQLTMTLSGLTGIAGTALPSTVWNWNVQTWQDAGSRFFGIFEADVRASLAVGVDGTCYASIVDTFTKSLAFAKAADGTWTSLEGACDPQCPTSAVALAPSLAVDSRGRLLVAALTAPYYSAQVRVWRFDGTSWVELGDALNQVATDYVSSVIIRVDTNDQPVVLWAERNAGLVAKRWHDASASWNDAFSLASAAVDSPYDFAFSSKNVVSVVYYEGSSLHLFRENEGTVNPQGQSLGAAGLSLTLDSTDTEIIAYIDRSSYYLHVDRLTPGYYPYFTPPGSLPSGTTSPFGANIAYRPGAIPEEQLIVGTSGGLIALDPVTSIWKTVAPPPGYVSKATDSQLIATGPSPHSTICISFGMLYKLGDEMPTIFLQRWNQ